MGELLASGKAEEVHVEEMEECRVMRHQMRGAPPPSTMQEVPLRGG
jgi:hypothetical protein